MVTSDADADKISSFGVVSLDVNDHCLVYACINWSNRRNSYVCYTPAKNYFTFKQIKLTDVFKLISCVKGKKASGPDTISAKLIKDSASIIAPSLTTIFNSSLGPFIRGKLSHDLNKPRTFV